MPHNYYLSITRCKLIIKAGLNALLFFGVLVATGLFYAVPAGAQALGWSTYIGGNQYTDMPGAIKVDHAGNILLGGYSYWTGMPSVNNGTGYFAAPDTNNIFIMKFDPKGVLTWSTPFGNTTNPIGSSSPAAELWDIAVDGSDNFYITGRIGFGSIFAFTGPAGGLPMCGPPTTAGFPSCDPGGGAFFDTSYTGLNWDGYIAKFNSAGVLQWSTLFGVGTCEEWNTALAVDASDNVYVGGYFFSSGCSGMSPSVNPGGGAYYVPTGTIQMPYIMKFNSSGVALWATPFATGTDPNREKITRMKTYGTDLYVVGTTVNATAGSPLCAPPTNGGFTLCDPGGGAYYQNTKGAGTNEDCFIAKFNGAGVLQWSTYYGGDNTDVPNDPFIDGMGNIFMAGQTSSSNFPVFDPGGGAYFDNTANGLADGFIVEFNTSGVRKWATYFGGNAADRIRGIITDPGNNIIITLTTGTSLAGIPACGVPTNGGIPSCNGGSGAYYQSTFGGGNNDALIAVFNSARVLQHSTYFGGNDLDVLSSGAIATNGVGDIFTTGFTVSGTAGSPTCGTPTNSGLPLCDPGGGAYYDATYNGGSNDIFLVKFNTSVQLPVDLLTFRAEPTENKYVTTTWNTTSETNNDYFLVERSYDLQNWEYAGKLKGAGNASVQHTYSLLDKQPYQGTSYYRLKQVDFNGDNEYYGPVPVRLDGMEILSIYPAPATDHISYSVVSSSESYVTLIIVDIQGRRVMNKIVLIHQGENKFSVPLNGMSEGYYLLRLEEVNGNSKTQKQFVVR